jgi:hypothetical protein
MKNPRIELVRAQVHEIGGYRNLVNIENLADCLLYRFPEAGRGEAYRTALAVCLEVMEGGKSTAADARAAFVAAAREVGVTVLPDDAA